MKSQLAFCLDKNDKVSGWACSPKKWENRPILLKTLREKHGNDLTIREIVTIEIDHDGIHPTCETCYDKLRISKRHFPRFCSNTCAQKSPLTRTRMITTWSQNGITDPLNSKSANDKRRATNLAKYGIEHILASGVSHLREGMLKKHGVEFARQSDNINSLAKENSIEKYGHEYYFQTTEFKIKQEKTFLEKYGVTHSSKDPTVILKTQEKRKKSIVENFVSSIPEKYRKHAQDIEKLYFVLKEEGNDTSRKIEEALGVSQSWVSINFRNFELKRNTATSHEEMSFGDDIEKSFGVNIERSNRDILGSREIDIWIPSHNLGIEYHGIYWHSSTTKLDLRVREKYELSRKNNTTLLQFWSSEVQEKRDIVNGIISSHLGKNKRIYARSCKIKQIGTKEHDTFCESNHLQGKCRASVRLGLYLGDQLVSVMSFSKSRFDKNIDWEMIRFCSKLGVTVVGGASKLWKHFIQNFNPKSIVSYADVRISNGSLYKTLGFDFQYLTSPNFWYTKDCATLESRIKYQKHKLPDYFTSFDITKSAKENMINNGYRIVYDGGNLVYTWRA